MFGLGATELIVILVIIVILFGAKRIPEIAAGVGKGIMNFKKSQREIINEIENVKDNDDKKENKDN